MAASGGEESGLLKKTKFFIRSTLISSKDGVLASRFMHDYQEFAGYLPYKELGYSSVADLCKDIPDVVLVRMVGGQLTYFAVADETTQHIHSLIQRQKSNPKKNKALKKGTSRFPKQQARGKQSFSFRGGYRPGTSPPSHSTPSRVSGFAHPKPFKSPILPNPAGFNSADVSPLMVTVRSRIGSREDERTIAKRGAGGPNQFVVSTLNSALKDRKPTSAGIRSYVLPPRFQRHQSGGSAVSTDHPDKPVAGSLDEVGVTSSNSCTLPTLDPPAHGVVQPSLKSASSDYSPLSEEELLRDVKSWTKELLRTYNKGFWSTRYTVLFKKKFGEEAPSNIMDIVQTWTDTVRVEFQTAAGIPLMFPVTETSITSSPSSHVTGQRTSETTATQKLISGPQWENFIVPLAQLFEVGEMTEVYASYSTDLNHFFLQREDSCVDEITEQLLQLHQKTATPRASDLQPGVFCAALYSQDDSWYRARVLFLHDDEEKVQVLFIDYGNAEKVAISDIRCLTQETAAIPAQAVGCVMFALRPFEADKGWSDAAKNTFANLMTDKKLQAYTIRIEDGSCVVELWSDDNDKSLNEQLYNERLVDTNLAKNFDPPELEFPQGGYLEVVVVFVGLTHCWLRLIGLDYSEKLEQFEDRLATLFSSEQHKRIQEGSVCIAHTDLYHRVKVKELRDNEANCFFVDHGYTEWFPLDKLVPLDTNENQSLPYQALQCVLVGLEDYMSNPTTITELMEQSRDKICVAEFIERDPLKVMLFDTQGNDDVNINEEIAVKLIIEGHDVALSQFTSTGDSGSELSRGSSPRPSANPVLVADMEALQSVAKQLTLSPEESSTTNDTSTTASALNSSSVEENAAAKTEQAASASQDLSETSAHPLRTARTPDNTSPTMLKDAEMSSPYSDSHCVAYNTWPLPAYMPQPEIGQFHDVFVQSTSDPSNFVIVPLNVMNTLERTMERMNAQFNAEYALHKYGDASKVQKPEVVSTPQANHLYMAEVEGVYKRAIYLNATQSKFHVFLPDFCEHELLKPEQLFFLPKKFWSMPFTAFRACLHGVKPASGSHWSEPAKYFFLQLTLHKIMVALLKDVLVEAQVEAQVGDKGDFAQVAKQKLSLYLVNTSDPETDVVVDEHLVLAGYATNVVG